MITNGTMIPAVSKHNGAAALLSPDGRWLAAPGKNNTVVVLDAASQAPWATYYGHQDGLYRREDGVITSVVWVTDEIVATGSSTGSIQLWNARTSTHRRTLRNAQNGHAVLALSLSHEGVLTAYSEGEIGTWQLYS